MLPRSEFLISNRFSLIAKRMSTLTRDRPINALETATYWVEYVLRHRGAPHMHYPGADLNFIQSNSLDVIGLLLLVLWISFKIIKFIFVRLCFRKNISTDTDKRRKKTKTN